MTSPRFRFLFCIPTTQLSGGVKVVFGVADGLVNAGHDVSLFSWAGAPDWCAPKAPMVAAKDISAIDMAQYDFVVVSNAMLIPMVLPHLGTARCVFLAQDYEAFHHSNEATYEAFLAESPAFMDLYRLPVPIIAASRPVQRLIEERIGRHAYLMPSGVDKAVFTRQPPTPRSDRRRVLLVGNYLMPYKGMRDGLAALELLSGEIPVELVLITQEERGRRLFDSCSYPVEIHFCPSEEHVPAIIGSCDVYCCTSWYEGLGLPALEAFLCGTPVVSTRSLGVEDYADDGANLLLAQPSDPVDLARQLRRVLTDKNLRDHLIAGGFATMSGRYDWQTSIDRFLEAITDIDKNYFGAGDVNSGEMNDRLRKLELTGSFTPIEVFREFGRLDERIRALCDAISDGHAVERQLGEIRAARDGLERFLTNEGTQYYGAFKARFDFCQLMLGLAESGDTKHVKLMIERSRKTPSASNASSHSETRYSE